MKFLYICRYSQNKRLDHYVRIARKFFEHEFYHIGGGSHRKSEQELINSGVIVMGSVDDETKNKLLHDIDAYVCTSDSEGFNLPILEAIRYNKPVFCKPIEIHCEIFSDYPIYCRTIEEFIAKIEQFTKNPIKPNQELRKQLIEKYTWENSARRLNKIIKRELKSINVEI